MSAFPKSQNFSNHCENLVKVNGALRQLERTHKRAIREGDEAAEKSLRKIHTLMLGVFAEARLRKIVDDPTGFSDEERQQIWLNRSQEEQWRTAVILSARKHWPSSPVADAENVLPVLARDRVESVLRLLRGALAPIITDRNKLAHGQWVWQLRSRSNDRFVTESHDLDYNYLEIVGRYKLLELVGRLVHVLCVSEPTFDRDFDDISKAIAQERGKLEDSGFAVFASTLRERYAAGVLKRQGAL